MVPRRAFPPSLVVLLLAVATPRASAQECGRIFPSSVYGLPAGQLANGLAIGDLTNDGRNDLVVTRWHFGTGGSRVEVLRGTIEGGDALASSFALPEAYDVALGDIDGDGNLDAVVTGPFSQAITVLAGDGLGGLAAPYPTAPTGASFTEAITTADFDGDGDDDVAIVTHTPATLRILLSAAGILGVNATLPIATSPLEVLSADLDQDGALDLAVLHGTGSVSFFAGDGLGGFMPAGVTATSGPATAFAAADFDGDPRPELVVANASSVTYLDAAAGFGYATSPVSIGPFLPKWLAALDGDGDGDQDIVLLEDSAGFLQTILGNGDGTFSLGELGFGDANSLAFAAGDLDADGRSDLASVSGSPWVTAYYQHPDGGVETSSKPHFTVGSGQLHDFVAHDLNGDARVDVLALTRITNPRLQTHFGDGTGAFSTGPQTPLSGDPQQLATGDVNGDGIADAAVSFAAPSGQSQCPLELRIGAGNGTFTTVLDTSFPAGTTPADVVVADVNNDAIADVIAVNSFNGTPGFVSVRQATGPGTFGPGAVFGAGITPRDAAVGDLDLDGDLDIVVCSMDDSKVTLALGDGAGGFAPTSFTSGSAPVQIVLTDLDLNGIPDLAIGLAGGGVDVRLALGGATFGPPTHYSVSGLGLAAADLDGDGDDDLAATAGVKLDVLLSRGDGTLGNGGAYRVVDNVLGMAVADFIRDGALDVLVVDSNTQGSLLRNRDPLSLPWTNLGGMTPGSNGTPKLVGEGALLPGCPTNVTLSNAAPSTLSLLFVSLASTPTPFLGGTLHPFPPLFAFSLTTSPTGTLQITVPTWPSGFFGIDLFLQYAIADTAAPNGAALSNGIRAQVP